MNAATAIERATLSELLPLIQRSEVTLSFWGCRRIQIPGYEGNAPIDSLAQRVMTIARAHKFEFTPQERSQGEEMAPLITHVYRISDRQVSESCCLTRLFCALESCFTRFRPSYELLPRTTSVVRWNWDNPYDSGFCDVFKYYTRNQYFEKYGR